MPKIRRITGFTPYRKKLQDCFQDELYNLKRDFIVRIDEKNNVHLRKKYSKTSIRRSAKRNVSARSMLVTLSLIVGIFVMPSFIPDQSNIVVTHKEETISEKINHVEKIIVTEAEAQVLEKQGDEIPEWAEVEGEKPKTQEEEIVEKIEKAFGNRAEDALKMLRTCENGSLNPNAINKANRNKTWDVGLFQINVDPSNTTEVEKLKNVDYNIERALQKYNAKNQTFYYWTCGNVIGDYTYVDYLNGR